MYDKIAVIGTHSAGKTTLAERISKEFGIPYQRGDKTQDIFKRLNFNKGVDELTRDEQWTLQQEILKSLDELQSANGPYVTDGSSLTCIPYGLLYSNFGIRNQNGFEDFITKARESARQTNLFIYLPPEIALEDDGFRPEDNNVRMDIDNFVYGLLKEGGYPFRTITGTIPQRLEQVGKILGKTKNTSLDRYIAFEGMPRAGKSTQLEILDGKEIKGHRVHRMKRFNSPAMKNFKAIRKDRPYDNSDETIELACEALQFDFDANEVYDRLDAGEIVISDRHKYSYLTLFGSLGVPSHKVYSRTYGIPTPSKVFLFDMNPNITVKRAIETGESSLKRDITFQRGIRRRYDELAEEYDFHKIDATQSIDQITQELIKKIGEEIENGRK